MAFGRRGADWMLGVRCGLFDVFFRTAGKPARRVLALLILAACSAHAASAPETDPRSKSPRELYNDGTARLREGKLEEAQDLLRAAAAANNESVRASAVYNLGHARYEIGDRQFMKTLMSPELNEVPRRAQRNAQAAIRSAQAALADGHVEDLVQAYRRGAGARKELREAAKAVEAALAQFHKVLLNWQKASASFHSVAELEPADTNASHNAAIVDRRIAELIDMLKAQKMAMAAGGSAGQELKGLMKEMRGKIPADKRGELPGEGEDGEEEDGDSDEEGDEGEQGREPREGEGRTPMTQEQAAQMLRGVQLDSQRTLPAGNPRTARPAKREGGDW